MSKFFKKSLINYTLLIIGFVSLLQACRNPPQSIPTVSPVPTTPMDTPTPNPTATSVLAASFSVNHYIHPNDRFSIDYPDNWEPFERPDGVIFVEPNDLAGYSVVYTDVGTEYTAQELNQYLVTFVAQNFAGEGSGFKAISQEQLDDGTIVAQFSSIEADPERAVSEVRVLQQDTFVYVVHLSTAEAQWTVSADKLQVLAESFLPGDTSPVAAVEATPEAPIWALIGPLSKEFGFLYAADWEILEQDEDLISVGQSQTMMIFTASKFSWLQAKSDPNAAVKAAVDHLEKLSGDYQNVQSLPPVEFPLDTAAGATIDFLYTTGGGVDMAGSVITAVYEGKMHKIVFMAPVDFYDAALQWFNPMYKSFKFLDPGEFIDELP